MPDFFSEGSGIVGAFAEGERIAQQRQMTQFEQAMQQKQFGLQEQDLSLRQQQAQRQSNMDALAALEQQEAPLRAAGNQIIRNMASNRRAFLLDNPNGQYQADPASVQQLDQIQQQLGPLMQAKQEVYKHIYGRDIIQAHADASALANDTHQGTRTLDDVEPSELALGTAAVTSRPIEHFIDTPNSRSDVGGAIDAAHNGMIAQQQGKGSQQLADSANGLMGHELQGLVGQYAYDHSKIMDAKIIGMPPNPGNPSHVTVAVQLQTQGYDGKPGTQIIPLMDDRGQFLAHPDQSQAATVRNYHLEGLFNTLGNLQTFHNVLNSPQVRGKAMEGALDEDTSAKVDHLIQGQLLLGSNPADLEPKWTHEVQGDRMLWFDEYGNLRHTSMLAQSPEEQLKAAGERAHIAQEQAQTGLLGAEMQSIQQGKGRWGIGAPGAGGTQLSPDAVEDAANYLRVNGTLPPGFSRDKATVAAVWNAASTMAKNEGQTSESEALQRVANKASQTAIKDMTTREAFLETNAAAAERNFQTLESLAAKVDRTGSPLLNRLKQAWGTKVVQDPDLAALKNAITEAATEYAKVVQGQTGGAGVTNAANEQAQHLISASDSPAAFAAEMKTMRAMIGNRRDAFAQEKANLMGSLKGSGATPDGTGGLLPKGKPLPTGWAIKKVQ